VESKVVGRSFDQKRKRNAVRIKFSEAIKGGLSNKGIEPPDSFRKYNNNEKLECIFKAFDKNQAGSSLRLKY
jgi:hypothetical protein